MSNDSMVAFEVKLNIINVYHYPWVRIKQLPLVYFCPVGDVTFRYNSNYYYCCLESVINIIIIMTI